MRDGDLKYGRLDKKSVGRLGQNTRVKMNETRQEAQKERNEWRYDTGEKY